MSTSKIRKSAKGKMCLVRLPGICTYNQEETIHAHQNGAGVAIKHNDILGARCCAACHREADKLPKSNHVGNIEDAKKLLYFYEAIFRTQLELIDEGLVIVK